MRRVLAGGALTILMAGCSANASGTAQHPIGGAGAAASSDPGTIGTSGAGLGSTAPPTGSVGQLGASAGSKTPPVAGIPGGSGALSASSADITVTLGAGCVVPGGRQTIAISTHGQASVSYGTRYADGAVGTYGGVRAGTTDSAGQFRDEWTVAPDAPAGSASVQAGMSRGGRWSTAPIISFTVAAHC